MKKNLITGLAILLPIALTFWIVALLITILTNPFVNVVEGILSHYHLLDQSFLFLTPHETLIFISRLLILLFLFLFLVVTGFFARHLFLDSLFKMGDYLIHRIPLVNKVYKATQDVVHTIFDQEKTTFSQVVLIPFPHPRSFCLGLIAKGGIPEGSDAAYIDKISVFVPGTPNPTFGFMLLYRKDQIIPLDMKVEDALKFVVSCGVITPPFTGPS